MLTHFLFVILGIERWKNFCKGNTSLLSLLYTAVSVVNIKAQAVLSQNICDSILTKCP